MRTAIFERGGILGDETGVVIPVYNRQRQVLEALAAVAKQTQRPNFVVVVDDGSEEPIDRVVERWRREFAPELDIRVARQTNRGAAAARNYGLSCIPEAAFVAFLDSDDLWPSDFLARAYATLRRVPDAIAATTDRIFEHGGDGLGARLQRSHEIEVDPTLWIFRHGGGIGSATLLRADPLRAMGGYDASILTGHDTALFLRLSLCGVWLHVPGEPVRYRSESYPGEDEDGHLRERYPDYRARWATIDEGFIREERERHGIPRSTYARQLARRWRIAGDQLVRANDPSGARQCFRRSLAWHIKWKTLLRLSRTFRRSGNGPDLHSQ
jgi:glycosyltransferase involved in cell wall biosynthesis